MKKTQRTALGIGAVVLVAAGLYYASYGATYYASYYALGAEGGPCQYACTFPSVGGPTVVFSGYPIWSPPSWNLVNYSASSCPVTAATYSPQNPPPSCLYPPAELSTDYSRNYGGVLLVVLGVLAMAVAVGSWRRESGEDPSMTA